jgi:hypothetical protein
MKRSHSNTATRSRGVATPRRPGFRTGSTLMIVIVLMGLLAVLGVLFYTFAAQERSNSEYYADGAKNVSESGLTADVLMDHALQQIIVSTDPRLKNSALWGSRHSLLANMLGVKDHAIGDLTAFDGQGVVVGVDSSGKPIVDYARSGSESTAELVDPDDTSKMVSTSSSGSNIQDLLGINDSPAANALFERNTGKFPQPDVGYTYPDINNCFLAYMGWTRDRTTGQVRRVIIPSFHRPQLNRDSTGAPIPLFEDMNYNGTRDGSETGTGNLKYGQPVVVAGSDPNRANRLFRPHPDQLYVPPRQQTNTAVRRFIHLASEAQSLLGDGKRVFPFLPMYPGYQPDYAGGAGPLTFTNLPPDWNGHQGVWSGPHPNDSSYTYDTSVNPPTPMSDQFGTTSQVPTGGLTIHDQTQYDVDNDKDGIREGVWLDLDFPMLELPDGTLCVPLFSATVYDLDSLFNLNVHGNIQNVLFNYPSGMAFNNATNPLGWNTNFTPNQMDFVAASNTGMLPSEVNPAWGLTARRGSSLEGDDSTIFGQYEDYFGNKPINASGFTGAQAPLQQALVSFQETANMELVNILMGRAELSSSGSIDRLYPGVYGEENLIARHLGGQDNPNNAPSTRNPIYFPHPGQSLNDDNNDQNEGMQTASQYVTIGSDRIWLETEQPFDALGMGSYLGGTNKTNPRQLNRYPTTGRLRWLRYSDYASNGNIFWGNTNIQTGNLMVLGSGAAGGQSYGRYDDPSETALWAKDKRDVDDPFPADETAVLHLSNKDISDTGPSSRLANLAKFNFSATTTENQRGDEIRKRYTTVSSDRKNFAAPRAPVIDDSGTVTGGRYWEWTDDYGNTFDTAAPGSKLRFPPTFGAAGSPISRYAVDGKSGATADDPFRPSVRYLLQSTRNDMQVKQFQQRLAVNQFLYFDSQSNQLVYRDLTPHPLDPGAAAVPTGSTLSVNTTDAVRPPLAQVQASPGTQEFWARRDRQQLARDIYVMLYLFGAPGTATDNDYTGAANPANISNASNGLYSAEQLEQMARFAVNLVDAQDRDKVFTRFEYDTDLSNGWNLDDDAYTVDSGSSDRAVVWGIERQELALSELIVVHATKDSGADRQYTAWKDGTSDYDRDFLTVELQNVAPYDVKFNDTLEEWQLMMRQEPTAGAPDQTKWRTVTFKNMAGRVSAGGFYTLFSTDQNEPTTNPSIFQVDPNGGTATAGTPANFIFPNAAALAGNSSSTGNFIDLVKESGNNGFTLANGYEPSESGYQDLTSTAGSLLNDGSGTPGSLLLTTSAGAAAVEVILRRRAHPTRSKPTATATSEADNPWVEVDRISASIHTFSPTSGTLTTDLDALNSRERRQILSRSTEGDCTNAGNISNSFGGSGTAAENSLAPSGGVFETQIHADRQFVSLGEILQIPLFGPPAPAASGTYGDKDSQTMYLGAARLPPTTIGNGGQFGAPAAPPPGMALGKMRLVDYAKTADAMFINPDYPDFTGTSVTNTPNDVDASDNRWFRVLEFLEVPTRQHKNLGMGSAFNIARVSGKLNLNTMRHAEVLGGFIDDENTVAIDLNYDDTQVAPASVRDSNYPNLRSDTSANGSPGDDYSSVTPYYSSTSGRDWFEELQNSRDPQDPHWNTIGGAGAHDLRLPGLALNTSGTALKGLPFRGFSYADDSGGSTPNRIIDHTLLRQLPIDAAETDSRRRLFEVGNHDSDHLGSAPLDSTLKYRLLSKIWGNTTVRSNTYVVFISAKLFRAAVDPATGATRIGGPVREFGTTFRGAADANPEEPEYRGVFIVDRSKLEEGLSAGGGTSVTSFTPFVAYRKILEE